MRTNPIAAAALAVALTVAGLTGGAAAAPPAAVAAVDPPVIPDSVAMGHIQQFQQIADANGGNRAHGRPGYKASLDYVKGKLDAAGFQTTVQPFPHNGAQGWNLIADWPHGDADNVLFFGAHLDGVPAGPGINDDASGSTALLSVAEQVSKSQLRPGKRLRFGWWGAEELGLVGSAFYTRNLPAEERKKINYYLNFDMVGAKGTTAWGVYKQSPELNKMWKDYFTAKGYGPSRDTDYSSRTDSGSFLAINVKVTGIGSGSDPCYHKACDTANNVDAKTMSTATNAVAHMLWKLSNPA